MADAVLLRCKGCGDTLRLLGYDGGTLHHLIRKKKELHGWLNAHAMHHAPFRFSAPEWGDDPGFEVVAASTIAPHDPAVSVNE